MSNPITASLAAALLPISVAALLCAVLRVSGLLCRERARLPLHVACGAVTVGYFLVWGLLSALALAGLSFAPTVNAILRWAMLSMTLLYAAAALIEHEWSLLLPGLFAGFTLPFFEPVFSGAFPAVLLVMLVGGMLYELAVLLRDYGTRREMLDLISVQEAADTMDDGLLFAAADGRILLCNSLMAELCHSLCREELRNAEAFWQHLGTVASTELLSCATVEGSYVFRFAGGNTWTLHRRSFSLEGAEITQIVALNVTESDAIRRQTALRRAELKRLEPEIAEMHEKLAALEAEEAATAQGHAAFESVTEKMTALERFINDHYALPAEAFDYRRLSELTTGILPELRHAPALTPARSLALTERALELLGVSLAIEGELPAAHEALFVPILREGAVNAVLHGRAKHILATFTNCDDSICCEITSDGRPLEGKIVCGSGIPMIEALLEPVGGKLEITKAPVFTLRITIPA